jgi:hypothetical protein
MKNKISIFMAVFVILFSCGENEPIGMASLDNAPSIPLLSVPNNNKLCISNQVFFEWQASTATDGNSIRYQLQVALDNEFKQIVHTSNVLETQYPVILDKGKAYYWRVKAVNNKNVSSEYSKTFNFYTEGVFVSNHLPFIPSLIAPSGNTNVSSGKVSLKWSSSDVDVNDIITYDVYLDTEVNPTTKVIDNKTDTSIDIFLQASKTYYWKVIAKDNKGGETSGQVWSFKTD